MKRLAIIHDNLFTSLWSVMHFPDDASKALGFSASYLAEEPLVAAMSAGYVWPDAQQRQFLGSISFKPSDVEVARRHQSGLVVGEIIRCLWILSRKDPSTASLDLAIQMVEDLAVQHGHKGSRTMYRKHLSLFAPVFHFWGAWALRERRFRQDPAVGYEYLDDLGAFMLEALTLHHALTDWRDSRGRTDQTNLTDDVFGPWDDWSPSQPKPGWPEMGAIPIMDFAEGVIVPTRKPPGRTSKKLRPL